MSQWKYALVAAGVGALVLGAFPRSAFSQESPIKTEGPEWAPVVKVLSGEDLPPAFRLTTKIKGMTMRAARDPDLATLYFETRGLDVTDADLDHLLALYGDFDERHMERHNRVLREHAGDMEKIRASGDRYVMERASFTGGVLGAWLATLRSEGQNTDRFVVGLVTEEGSSAFWGGRAPTIEELEREASAFEKSFHREYGVALSDLLAPETNGGAQ